MNTIEQFEEIELMSVVEEAEEGCDGVAPLLNSARNTGRVTC